MKPNFINVGNLSINLSLVVWIDWDCPAEETYSPGKGDAVEIGFIQDYSKVLFREDADRFREAFNKHYRG